MVALAFLFCETLWFLMTLRSAVGAIVQSVSDSNVLGWMVREAWRAYQMKRCSPDGDLEGQRGLDEPTQPGYPLRQQ
jgi:hypothetical protein